MDSALKGKQYLVGGKCTKADLAFVNWDLILDTGLKGGSEAATKEQREKLYPFWVAWHKRLLERPAVQKIMHYKKKSTSHSCCRFFQASIQGISISNLPQPNTFNCALFTSSNLLRIATSRNMSQRKFIPVSKALASGNLVWRSTSIYFFMWWFSCLPLTNEPLQGELFPNHKIPPPRLLLTSPLFHCN
jgi:hypothetical protein